MIRRGRDRGAVFCLWYLQLGLQEAAPWRHQCSRRPHIGRARQPDIVRTRAMGRRCRLRASKFFCCGCLVSAGSCPEQSPNFSHASHKAGRAIDGLGALSRISRRNDDNNSGPFVAIYPNAPRILPEVLTCPRARNRKNHSFDAG